MTVVTAGRHLAPTPTFSGGLALVSVLTAVPVADPVLVIRLQLLVTPQIGPSYLTVQDLLVDDLLADLTRLRPGSRHIAGRYAADDPGLELLVTPSADQRAAVRRIPPPSGMVPRWWTRGEVAA